MSNLYPNHAADQTKNSPAFKALIRFITGLFAVLFIAGAAVGFSSTKADAAVKTGFSIETENNQKVCYYYYKGVKCKNKFITVNGKIYYFDEKGHQVTGWLKLPNSYVLRYFYKYLGEKGYLVTGYKMDGNGNVRYFDQRTGAMAVGCTLMNGEYRYFDKTTGFMYTGSRRIGNYYYYFDESKTIAQKGIMYRKGWLTVGGKTRYYDERNGKALVGWLSWHNKLFRLGSDGVLVRNSTFTIGGKKYKADVHGVVTEVVESTYDPTYTAVKPFSYTYSGGYLNVYDKNNGRYYKVVNEFATDTGVANGRMTDRDILAALCEAEAGNQGLIGMEAVAMCILNRTIKADKEFPSEVRLVIYQTGPRQYSTTMGAVNQRLNGSWINKTLAYKAVDEAMKTFTAYRRSGKPRVIPGFYNNQDVNFMYFMMYYVFSPSYSRGGFRYDYLDHTFFIDWV